MTKGDCERICPRFRLRNEELNLFSTFGSCPWAGVGFAMQKPGDLWQHFPQSPGSFCPLEQKVGPLQNSHFATVPFFCSTPTIDIEPKKRERVAFLMLHALFILVFSVLGKLPQQVAPPTRCSFASKMACFLSRISSDSICATKLSKPMRSTVRPKRSPVIPCSR